MRRTWMVGIALAAVLGAACGKSEAEKQAEEMEAAAEKLADQMEAAAKAGDTDAAAGMAGMAEAMKGMADAMAGGEGTVSPVGFRDLQAALPEISGWTMDTPKGERMTSPVPFSQTEASYERDGARIDVKIVDSGFSQLLMAPWAMFLSAGYERETDEGYERAVTIDGNPGFEKWDSTSKDGELNVVVAKRFLVTVEGRDLSDMSELRDVFEKIDTSKLEALGKQP